MNMRLSGVVILYLFFLGGP